ncbi:MAG: hypothetical protein RBQ81_08865 [Arcobacteraceae bacterium]|jgi:hypothetical protein|nr:hypothetical protein [Arcobacteraceae bacterium]
MKIILSIMILLFISGCTMKYQEPTDIEYSTLSVPNKIFKRGFNFTLSSHFVSSLNTNNCVEKWKEVEKKNSDFEVIKIPANKEFAIYYQYFTKYGIYKVFGAFKPKENKHYVVSSKCRVHKCYIYVHTYNNNGEKIFVKVKKGVDNLKTNHVCFPIFDEKGQN